MIITTNEDIVLRDFEETDIPKKVEWINNPENNRFLHYELPARVDKTLEWFKEKDNSKRLDCVIEYEGVPVGLIGLLQINKIDLKAEYYISAIDTSFKHKGIATKATEAIIKYAFTVLGISKIYLTVDAENTAARRLYEKVGFIQEGYFKNDIVVGGKPIDRIRYAFFKEGE